MLPTIDQYRSDVTPLRDEYEVRPAPRKALPPLENAPFGCSPMLPPIPYPGAPDFVWNAYVDAVEGYNDCCRSARKSLPWCAAIGIIAGIAMGIWFSVHPS